MAVNLQKKYVTYEEFLALPDVDFAEWVDGEVIEMTPPSVPHQRIILFLATVLSYYNDLHELGEVFVAPFNMRLETIRRGREPDVSFISPETAERLRHNYLDGAADLVIEITSPESEKRDRNVKFQEYQAVGVREYWIIDPDDNTADFYVLDEHGVYQRREAEQDGIYHSVVMAGFWLDVSWLWQSPLPNVARICSQYDKELQDNNPELNT